MVRGSPEVIEVLNNVLTAELTAINQYFVDAQMCANWGYERLAEHIRADSIDEMKDAEKLIDRILYLEGVPNLQRLGTVRVGETVPEKLQLALDVERDAVERLNQGVAVCVAHADNGSRELLERLKAGEHEHAHCLESQQEMIRQVGEDNYLAQQIRS